MWCEENKIVKDLFFKQTCVVAPEQYDVFLGDKMVAYVRCRWGKLKVEPILKEIIIPNVINITDHDYESYIDSYIGIVDYNHPFYEVEYEDRYKTEIPKEEFEKIADAIYKHLEIKKEQ